MSVALGSGPKAPRVPQEELRRLASKADITLREDHLDDFAVLLGSLDANAQYVLDQEDYVPKVDLQKYPRTDISIPGRADSDEGGWAAKCKAYSTSPTSHLLKGRTIALKDNVALAGVKCTNGTEALDWTPTIDATIATRIMDAGALITGKSACENACLEGVSDTSCTGNVSNPWAEGYSCGGSSSGSGRLVASGTVDMAIGCDQGGSIRIPSANCGIVGLKPTWGLVPYTGIVSLEATIDHTGPMAKSVPDVARLLQVIAGNDCIDDRQPPFLPDGMLEYVDQLDHFLKTADPSKPLSGVKVGILEEGFAIAEMYDTVSKVCHSAVEKLKDLGAEVTSVSVPIHTKAANLWMCNVPIGGTRQGFFADMTGRKQLQMLDRIQASDNPLTQKAFDAFSPGPQNAYMRYLLMTEKYGPMFHAKCTNLVRKNTDDYNNALKSVDVLVMPTLPSPPCRLFDNPSAHGPIERLTRNVGLVGNTAPFNSSGHPALTIPVGFVPAMDDENIKLPTGLQIVGKKFAEIDVLKVGAAWERAYDWKTL